MIRLLVVDDSALMRRLLGQVFAAEGDFETHFARDGAEALELIPIIQPNVVTLDVAMPRLDGLACLDLIMLRHPCPVVMVSSLTEAGTATTLTALDRGAVDFIAKPAGAVSLGMDELGPALVDKVRAAAAVRLRATRRLAERVRLRAGEAAVARPAAPPRAAPRPQPRPTALQPAGGEPAGLLLVGCSTGGPPALDAVLSRLPADLPWAAVVAQHMPASFTGALAHRLDKLCAISVVEVAHPMPLVAGRVYIGRGDADVVVVPRPAGLSVMAVPSSKEHRWHPSVDRLVDSALEHLPAERLMGVLMTGMGNDGAAAMGRLRAAGGITIAEAEDTAVVWGMPGQLVRQGGAAFVEPLDAIADRILGELP